jgi:hypothetical protein
MKHALYFFTVLFLIGAGYTYKQDVLEIYPSDITFLDNEHGNVEIYGKTRYIGQDAANILLDNSERDLDLEMVAVFRTYFFGVPFVTDVKVILPETENISANN